MKKKAHSLPAEELLSLLKSSKEGLSSAEAKRRLEEYGLNAQKKKQQTSLFRLFFRQLKSPVIALLALAGAAALAFGELVEAGAIFTVLLLNTLIGFFMELSGVRTMEALLKLGTSYALVLRDGKTRKVKAEKLVPGDLVLLEAGDRISADMRVLEASRLKSDESSLTGESLPLEKRSEPVAEETALAERTNMLYKGCIISQGSGRALVVATGMETELGKITSLVEESEEEITPLEKRLASLGNQLIGLILAIAAAISLLGAIRGYPIFLMVEISIALAVAAIPEGLPVVATLALSRGLMRMARRNGLVRSLSSVETLGNTTLICTDKTGTLTENRMVATRILLEEDSLERGEDGSWSLEKPWKESPLFPLLRAAALCSSASSDDGEVQGEPTETALIEACLEIGMEVNKFRKNYPEERREPFDSETKMMATFHRTPDKKLLVAVKGAPEELFPLSLDAKKQAEWEEKNRKLASDGFRVLAFAEKRVEKREVAPYEKLEFLGLVGLYDPPRKEVKGAIQECKQAGMRVVMVTGDQAETASYVARYLGLVREGGEKAVTSRDFSKNREAVLASDLVVRVTPENKLDLIKWHQERGEIVAMTGDGVNDAPALKKADIGIAMGQRGTEVAREAADLILLDDAFQTIVAAVFEGRVIFDNIRDFARYLLSCNLAEILVIFIASIANAPLPILPLQILFLNMATDVFPALALGIGKGEGDELKRPPRPTGEGILTSAHWKTIAFHALYMASATLLSFWLASSYLERGYAVTVSFLTLAFSQLLHVFNIRQLKSPLFSNHISRNPYIWSALAFCSLLLAATVYLPYLSFVLRTEPIPFLGWAFVLSCSLLPLALDSLARLKSRFKEP